MGTPKWWRPCMGLRLFIAVLIQARPWKPLQNPTLLGLGRFLIPTHHIELLHGTQAATQNDSVVRVIKNQGCKRDLGARDRDETETFDLGLETRPRPKPSEAETETFFRDLFVWPLAYIIITAIYTIQIKCGTYINDWMIVFLLFLWTTIELQARVPLCY
jgi:hypothetical protein